MRGCDGGIGRLRRSARDQAAGLIGPAMPDIRDKPPLGSAHALTAERLPMF